MFHKNAWSGNRVVPYRQTKERAGMTS